MQNPMALRRAGVRGFSLVELLLVAVILMALSAGAFYVMAGGKNADGTRKQTPVTKSKDTVCASNLRQVRMSIGMAHDSDPDGKFPASLDEMKEVRSIRECPDGHEPYVYDPSTGQVHCPHPGHEKL